MLSRWASLRSDRTLPLENVASQFQYRHYINWEVAISSLGLGLKQGKGSWKFQILLPDDTVWFEQEVELTVYVISLGSYGMQLFTWYLASEKITTTRVGGAVCDELNPSWQYTIGGTEFSEFGTMEAGGGSDYTDFVAIITDWWDSPVYNMYLPVGAKLRVIHDRWGLGISRRPEWQFRFTWGTARVSDSIVGPFGELENVGTYGGGGGGPLRIGHSFSPYTYASPMGLVESGRDPSVGILSTGVRSYAVMEKDGFWEYQSLDMGRTVSRVLYVVPGGPIREAPLFGPEVLMPQLIAVDEYRYAIAVKGSELVFRRISADNVKMVATIGRAVSGESYNIVSNDAGLLLIVDHAGVPVYTSEDKGLSWGAVE